MKNVRKVAECGKHIISHFKPTKPTCTWESCTNLIIGIYISIVAI